MDVYAVLVSRGKATHDSMEQNSEYWWDTILVYKKLIGMNVRKKRIKIFYGDGASYNSTDPTKRFKPHIDGACDNATLRAAFKNLNKTMKRGDILVVWWLGHGETPCGGTDVDFSKWCSGINHLYQNNVLAGSQVAACTQFHSEFMELIDLVHLTKLGTRFILLGTCYSGRIKNFIPPLNPNGKTLLVTSCSDGEQGESYCPAPDGLFHSEFNWHIVNSFNFHLGTFEQNLQASINGMHMSSTPQFFRF